MTGRLLDAREVSERLRCSLSMVRKLARLGKIDVVQIGRLPRFTEEAIETYVDRATRRASAPMSAIRGGRRP